MLIQGPISVLNLWAETRENSFFFAYKLLNLYSHVIHSFKYKMFKPYSVWREGEGDPSSLSGRILWGFLYQIKF